MQVTIGDYESTRAAPGRLLVLRGHESRDADDVIGQVNGYLVVERSKI